MSIGGVSNPLNALEVLGYTSGASSPAPAAVAPASNPLNAMSVLGYGTPGGSYGLAPPTGGDPLNALNALGILRGGAVASAFVPTGSTGFVPAGLVNPLNAAEVLGLVRPMDHSPLVAVAQPQVSTPAFAGSLPMLAVDDALERYVRAIGSDSEGARLLTAARARGLSRIRVGGLPAGVAGQTYGGTITISPDLLESPTDLVLTLGHELAHSATPYDRTSMVEETGAEAIGKRIQERVWPGATSILNVAAYNLKPDNGFKDSMASLGIYV